VGGTGWQKHRFRLSSPLRHQFVYGYGRVSEGLLMPAHNSVRSFFASVIASRWALPTALVLLLVGTRSQFVVEHLHFAPWLRAPDATIAVFFLAGLWIASVPLVVVLLAASALSDQLAFANGISDWCFTPAYACLIPAYLTMWFAGRLCRQTNFLSIKGAVTLVGALVVACGIEFVISSGSFFLWSGYFADMTAGEYWSRTVHYYPSYLGWAAVYVVAAFAIATAIQPLKKSVVQQSR
jgi:hypothetical protein